MGCQQIWAMIILISVPSVCLCEVNYILNRYIDFVIGDKWVTTYSCFADISTIIWLSSLEP